MLVGAVGIPALLVVITVLIRRKYARKLEQSENPPLVEKDSETIPNSHLSEVVSENAAEKVDESNNRVKTPPVALCQTANVISTDMPVEIATIHEPVAANNRSTLGETLRDNAKLRRAFIFLEDSEWERADSYLEAVLDEEPENAYAYLGRLMLDLHVNLKENLKFCK